MQSREGGIQYEIMTGQVKKEWHVIISRDIEGDLTIPLGTQAIVLFAHGSGSSRYSSRNQFVASTLNDKGIATLLVDLLNQEEKRIDERTSHLRYDIELLARRFQEVTNWLAQEPETKGLKIGYFGSSTGAAAALIAGERLNLVKAIVTRGGRPDLAEESTLRQVNAPTLFIVGGNDKPVIEINKNALELLSNAEVRELAIIPGAAHLFEEPNKMEQVAYTAADWFECYLLETDKKFHNKYAKRGRGAFLSTLWNGRRFQIRLKDRFAAGEMLALMLGRYKNNHDQGGVTIIGIARGGIIVAAAIAKKLNTDFDIVVPRKLRSPHNSENAIGAIMHDGSVYLDKPTLETQNDISEEYINMEKSKKLKEMEDRLKIYRPEGREYKIEDRTVILVDDGISTGSTMIAAARWIRKHKPKRLVIAAPVAPKQVIQSLENEVDEIELIINSSNFEAVEQFYHQFHTVSDDQILRIVDKHL